MKHRFMLFILLCALIFAAAFTAMAQAAGGAAEAAEPGVEPASGEPEKEKPVIVKVEPQFPAANNNIIFIEGEDAVSTNFNKEPTLNYSCSGSRTLQLSRSTGLQENAVFYAEYLFFAEEPGTYELWYGGTPPGPQEEEQESYASPFRYSLDGGAAVESYRKHVVVVEEYAPSYYWNITGDTKLERGKHKIRFEVKERRRYDNLFYFYIDAFFFVKKEGGQRIPGTILPSCFPVNMDDRSLDTPFKSIDDLLILIRDNPDNIGHLLSIATMYSMLNDYLNAIKYLKRAAILDPVNEKTQLLLAKNYIWKGDVGEGLKRYRDLLNKNPGKIDIWMEAGKVAAWTSRYNDSVNFYNDALEKFARNTELMINLGITLLWDSRGSEAEKIFTQAFNLSKEDPALLKALAQIYIVNGYPDRAAAIYELSKPLYPADVEFYILQEMVYNNMGETAKVQAVKKQIEDSFFASQKLTDYLAIENEKQGLKEALIREYRDELEKNPDNLALRELLAQTLFWNGLKREAINEYLNILANYTFRSLKGLDLNAAGMLEVMDKLYVLKKFFQEVPAEANRRKAALTALLKAKGDTDTALLKTQEKIKSTEDKIGQYNALIEASPDKTEATTKRIDAENLNLNTYTAEYENTVQKLADMGNEIIRLITEGQKYYENYMAADSGFEAVAGVQAGIVADEEKEQLTFEKVIATTNWEWNEVALKDEMTADVKNGLDMARHILGKLAQLENKAGSAEGFYKELLAQNPESAPASEYGLFEVTLWNGKIQDALGMLEKGKERISGYAAYTTGLGEYIKSLLIAEGQVTVPAGVDPESFDFAGAANNLLNQFNEISVASKNRVKGSEEQLKVYHGLLYKRMIRVLYQNQEETYLIRNELGNFYRNDGKLKEAIVQFNQVLAMDPLNISAIYQLGLVYQWNQDWKAAMNNYQYVYENDPYYENALGLYNGLARQYADTMAFDSNYLSSPSTVEWSGTLNYRSYINSTLSFTGKYDLKSYRAYKSPGVGMNPYSYFVHDISIGLPVDFYTTKISLTPYAGASLPLQDTFYKDELAPAGTTTTLDFLRYITVDPYFQLDAVFGKGTNFTFESRSGYRRYPETVSFFKANVYEVWSDLNFRMNTSFAKVFPLEGSLFRTYGKLDYLLDGNILWGAGQYMDIRLFAFDKPVVQGTFNLGVLYQDTMKDTVEEYYTPQADLSVDGGFNGSLALETGAEDSLTLTGTFLAGLNFRNMDDPARMIQSFLPSGDLTFRYTHKAASFYTGVYYKASYQLQPAVGEGADPWGYWTMQFKLGYSAALPAQLSP